MRSRGWYGIALCWLLCSVAAAASSFSASEVERLSKDPYWHILLHLKNGKSDIDDPSFFLSDPRHFSPVKELHATVERLNDANQTFYCRFPARIAWLREKRPEWFADPESTRCLALEETLRKESVHAVSLVFPTAYINSPASMFGHTFLRLDRNPKTPLIGEAVNYAAKTGEENGFFYTLNGLTGGYRGYFSVLPYYAKIKEYSAMEQRDMWEYRLDLNDAEIRRMLYHLYELQGIYSDYYFFTKNCSYNLLWLLAAAKKSSRAVDQFHYKAIPIDTLRAVAQEGMITQVTFRPSERRIMQAYAQQIDDPVLAKKFVRSGDTGLLAACTPAQQAVMADLGIKMLKHARTQKKMEKKVYVKKLMRLLRFRSKLPKTESVKIAKPADPLKGHKSARMTLGISGSGEWRLGLKPAMHDRYDLQRGFVEGAYIDFLALEVTKSGLERIDFVSVTSLAVVDRFFKPLSWHLRLGVDPLFDHRHYVTLEGGVGKSFSIAKGILYGMLTPKLYLGRERKSAAGVHAGYLKSFSNLTLGVTYRSDYFDTGMVTRHSECFATVGLGADLALNLKLLEDKIGQKREGRGVLSLFYYF